MSGIATRLTGNASVSWAGGASSLTATWFDVSRCLLGVSYVDHTRWGGGKRLSLGLLVLAVDLYWGMK